MTLTSRLPLVARLVLRLAAATVALVAAGSTARADDGTGVVVVGEATLQPALVAQIEGWVKQHQPPLVPQALDPDAVNSTIDCFVLDDVSCARAVFEKKGKTTNLVFVRVEVVPGPGGVRDITLTGFWFTKGHEPQSHKKTCEHCSDAGVHAAADEILAGLAHSGNHDTGHLALTSKPVGSHITVDGKPAGVTPLELDLPAGDHRLALERDGVASEARLVTIRIGETAQIDMSLGGAAAADSDGGPAHLYPKLVIGAGAALLVAGGVLIGTSQSDTGESPTYRDTTALGAVVGVVGVLAIGGGAYWWHVDKKRESAPVVAATPGGAFVGWAGSF